MSAPLGVRAGARRALVATTLAVAGLGLAAELARHLVLGRSTELVEVFSLSVEGNVPTWYASTLLAASSAMAALAAIATRRAGGPHPRRWALLSLLFAYVSLDETACLHEQLNAFVDGHGIFFFGWVLVAALVLVPLAVAYVPFLRDLPTATRRRFLLSALLYVGGAVGVELPLGAYTEAHGDETLAYALLDFVEEGLELAGLTVFLLALGDHLNALGVRLVFPEEPTP